jgi:hypothetical protein
MNLIKKLGGFALLLFAAGNALLQTIILFFPQWLFSNDPRIMESLASTRYLYLGDFGSFLGWLLDLIILPNVLFVIAGVLVLRVPSRTVVRAVKRLAAAFRSQKQWSASRAVPEPEQGPSRYKIVGRIAVAAGVLIVGYGLLLDVSVPTGYGRVLNIGLMADRQNALIFGGFSVLIGLVVTMMGRRN